jgi:uncharacterized protein YbjT (DUF2867 family)
MNRVAVFGGTGFLGRAIVDQLVAMGMTVRLAVRHPDTMKDGTLSRVYNGLDGTPQQIKTAIEGRRRGLS